MTSINSTQKNKRVGRPSKEALDKHRTILWFWAVANKMGETSAYQLEKFYFENNPNSHNRKEIFISSGRFNKYKSGKHVPNKQIVEWFEGKFPGTRIWLEHPFWKVALPSIAPQILHERLAQLRPGINEFLFQQSKIDGLLPTRIRDRSTDLLIELDMESDWDALTACIGLIHEANYNQEQNDLEFLRLITLRIFCRAICQLPSLMVASDLFSHLQTYFLSYLDDDEWTDTLNSISVSNTAMTNRLILNLIDDLEILKYFKKAPQRCLYYGQHYLTTKPIFQLWDEIYTEDGINKVMQYPEVKELSTCLTNWETQCFKDKTIYNYPNLNIN